MPLPASLASWFMPQMRVVDMILHICFLFLQDAHCEKIRMLFSEIDEDESGVITYQMFEKGIRSEEVKTLELNMPLPGSFFTWL